MTERDFQPLQQGEWEDIYVPPQKLRQRSWQAMKKNKLAIIGLCIVLFMTIVAIVGPFFSPYSYADQNFAMANSGPSWEHWLSLIHI